MDAEGKAPNGAKPKAKRKPAGQKNDGAGQPKAGGRSKAAQAPEPPVIVVRPMAERATMRKRHWGLALSFLLIVVLPLIVVGVYLARFSVDQYASTTGFSVRTEEVGAPTELLGGLSQFVGSSSGGETDMLYGYLLSQDIITAIDEKLDLQKHYTEHYSTDPFFSLAPGGTIEDLVKYWGRIVQVSYDQSTRLITLRVLAFSPEMAQKVAQEIVVQSQILVNDLNTTARSDSLKYAQQDLADTMERVKEAREALVNFRTRTQIVDPQSDLQGRMGVLNGLQQQLAQALIAYDLIAQDSAPSDPRVIQAKQRISVIRDRISEERRTFAQNGEGDGNEAYPALLSEYERLMVDREFAEGTYRAALAAFDVARANAARQSRYLATFIQPTLPQKSEYPRRWLDFGLAALFIALLWSVLSMMFYALKDRK